MDQEIKAVKDNLYRMCWFMRGGLSITEAFELTADDIDIINNIIKNNLDTTKETRLPFF